MYHCKKELVVAVDCDGVLADFVGSALALINSKLGTDFRREEVNKFDIFEALDITGKEYILHDAVATNHFCANLKTFPGVKSALDKLRIFCEVVCVTAPFEVAPWMHERQIWLQAQMGFDKHNIVHSSGKYFTDADILVEDGDKNVEAWLANRSPAEAYLLNVPYARHISGAIRARDFVDVVNKISQRHLR